SGPPRPGSACSSSPFAPPPASALSLSFFSCSSPLRDPPSFPTRRSSDLACAGRSECRHCLTQCFTNRKSKHQRRLVKHCVRQWRSEEHTSELQSRFDLVCRLLLEKKKTAPYRYHAVLRRSHVRAVRIGRS